MTSASTRSAPGAEARPSSLRLWVFLLAVGVSVLGDMVFSITIVLRAGDLAQQTGRSWLVTEADLLALLPPIVAGPLLGRHADRFDALKLWRTTLALECLVFLALPLVAGSFQIVVACLAVLNAVTVLSAGAAFKVLPRYAGRDSLSVASAHWVSVQSAATLPSAPLGGFLYGVLGFDGVVWANAGTFLVVLAVLFLNAPPLPAASPEPPVSGAAEEASAPPREAVVSMLLRHPVLGLLVLPAFCVVFSTSLEAVPSVFFLRGLAPDDLLFGLALAAWTLGMIPGARWTGPRLDTADNRKRRGRLLSVRAVLLGGGVVMGLSLFLESWAGSIWLVLPLFALGGAANGAVNLSMRAAVYEYVPEHFQGRTWAYWRVLSSTAAVAGMVLGTPTAFLGPAELIRVAGLLAMVGCGSFLVVAAVRGRPAE